MIRTGWIRRGALSAALVAMVLHAVGCGAGAEASYRSGDAGYGAMRAEATGADAPAMDDGGISEGAPAPMQPSFGAKRAPDTAPNPAPGTGVGGAGTGNVGEDRKSPILIYKADFTLAVYEVQKSVDAVQALAEKSGGYLARRDDTSITIRVPAGTFQNVVTDIGKLGDVLNRNVTSEDVTAEFRDLEVQLANALAMRERFAKLLEKAQKVDEALQIEKELGRVTDEIERIKGRLKLLSDLAQYSTITVRFSPHASQQVQQGPFILPLPWLDNLGLPRLLQL
ncbi:MAG: DUF4349 domain-containing protein [Polyangiaceae bacterium]